MPYSTAPLVHHATSASSADILGSAREFIKDKLYFTTLTHAPATYPDAHFFSIDHTLVYISFFSDFGPNNLAHVIRFCDLVEDKMVNPRTADKKLCLYSSHDSDKRANAAFLICAYMLLVHGQPPDAAFAPLASLSPPFVPYRDAGYGAATYHITILDCLRGLFKALTLGLVDVDAVDVDEYEFYEKVENGDLNWVTGKFLALASPKDEGTTTPGGARGAAGGQVVVPSGTGYQGRPSAATQGWTGGLVSLISRVGGGATTAHQPPTRTHSRFQPAYTLPSLIHYLLTHNLTTLIRLNNRTYDRTPLLAAGITHIELYFPDGTTPPDGILARFLEICETTAGPVAVHCKAGLGRTGTLIAAYLMRHYKMTASEVIGLLRVLRPGSVVGPQQNYLQSMQAKLHKMHPTAPLPPHISLLTQPTYPALQRWKRRRSSVPTTTTTTTATASHFHPTSPTSHPSELAALERLSLSDSDHVARRLSQMTLHNNNASTHSGVNGADRRLEAERKGDSVNGVQQMPIPGQPRKAPAPPRSDSARVRRADNMVDAEGEIRQQVLAAKDLARKTNPPPTSSRPTTAPTSSSSSFSNYTTSRPAYHNHHQNQTPNRTSNNTSLSSHQPRSEKTKDKTETDKETAAFVVVGKNTNKNTQPRVVTGGGPGQGESK
ncbi:dual specificity protein phosphatase [Powellomyces hirtus]|nr:dual specificity protein phosphatase [Powellomyces hirtus]